ncbi:MAG: 50S ribosomal protein L29 [Microthrixaceae bacterium]|nr:50S ribosomal protein L29 [Microthrixaceae bacterium]MCO5314340.1 50S ribosomal protein L29 [Microthrixaceae bacterium]
MAKNTVLADLDDSALLGELANRRKELFELRFKLATGGLEQTSKLKAEKRQIARILTELRAREIAAAEAADKEASA